LAGAAKLNRRAAQAIDDRPSADSNHRLLPHAHTLLSLRPPALLGIGAILVGLRPTAVKDCGHTIKLRAHTGHPAGKRVFSVEHRIAERLGPDARIATLMVDSGLKYLSTDVFKK